MKIVVSVTTVSMSNAQNDWRSQVVELKKFRIAEAAVFPTGLKEKERYELYRNLKEAGVTKIPLVHLLTEMKPEEIGFLLDSFETDSYNLHSIETWPLQYDYSEWKKDIYLENGKTVPTNKEFEEFGGVCIDFSHWHNASLLGNDPYCDRMVDTVKHFKTGVSHLSAIKKRMIRNPFRPEFEQYDSHLMEDLTEFNYLTGYRKYLAPINAIELENSIEDQLKVKAYIEKLLNMS